MHMDNLEYIISDDAAADGTTVQTFPSLKKLELINLRRLEGWWENKIDPLQEATANCFPALDYLSISMCPEMASSLPLAPCLKSLSLINCKKIPLGSINALTSLVSLDIETHSNDASAHVHDPVDSFLPYETVALRHLQCLEELSIGGPDELTLVWGHDDANEEEGSGHSCIKDLNLFQCDWIFSSSRCHGFWTSMASLESLSITSCDALIALPRQVLQGLTSLKRLEIEGCHNMTAELSGAHTLDACLLPQLEEMSFLDVALETVPRIWGPSLKKLSVLDCENFVSLAASEQDLGRLTSLDVLCIRGCPGLTSLVLDGLTALDSLELADCSDLASVSPARAVLPNLQELSVWGCPQLEKKCAMGGEYWSLISNIPSCVINGYKYGST